MPRMNQVDRYDKSWLEREAAAGESIAVVQMAMPAGMDYTAVRDAIITHLTIAEGVNLLFTPAYLEA